MSIQLLGSKPTRFGFGDGLVSLGERHSNVIVLGGDITGSVMTSLFRDKFPDRFFSIGIAEQNATTIAAGLALSGKIPFFASYGAFCALRNADQLRISVAYNEANVKIGGGHAGISVGPDGATHQVLEEVAFLRTLPHMTMIVPADYEEARKATIAMGEMVGPAYIRFGRSPVPMFTTEESRFELGKANQLTDGDDVAIIACGAMVWESIQAASQLAEKGIKARVINVHTIKPFDFETVTKAARECGAIVTAEEHQVHGGLGGAVAECTAKNAPVPIEFVGVKDSFGGSGEPEELMVKFGLTSKEIAAAALVAMERRDKGSSGIRRIVD
ncbi:MAG: transketolase family protein ['Candidatus Kapabacteria' thiocyanatum]|uniref:Transketolase n=1 Tax=Candidatus Kapaibacterium thiocyanatum TaxID=1895771 RepID=A0A1M3KYP7_9BACT|nr:transketolase family protein ['Candidatus Kapabacteria' thiocyanatum]OJX57632.1 MAG: transketolase ['Candidatus Kapabacteria' thiocyanatum]